MKKKDSYYFPHYYNNKDDASLARLIWGKLGVEGYGIYWILIETLRGADEYHCQLSDLDIIARKYNTDPQKMESVVKDYGLFEIDGEVFFSPWLSEVMEEVNKLIEKRSEAGKKGNEKRWGSDSNRNAIAMRSGCDRNKIKEKINKSKVKGNKIKKNKNTGREYKESLPQLNPGEVFSIPKNTDDQHPLNDPPTHEVHAVAGSAAAAKEAKTPDPDFEAFWEAYGKKRGRRDVEAYWARLPARDKAAALSGVPGYVAANPDPAYRKDPIRYLRHRCWEDENYSTTDKKPSESHDTERPTAYMARYF